MARRRFRSLRTKSFERKSVSKGNYSFLGVPDDGGEVRGVVRMNGSSGMRKVHGLCGWFESRSGDDGLEVDFWRDSLFLYGNGNDIGMNYLRGEVPSGFDLHKYVDRLVKPEWRHYQTVKGNTLEKSYSEIRSFDVPLDAEGLGLDGEKYMPIVKGLVDNLQERALVRMLANAETYSVEDLIDPINRLKFYPDLLRNMVVRNDGVYVHGRTRYSRTIREDVDLPVAGRVLQIPMGGLPDWAKKARKR